MLRRYLNLTVFTLGLAVAQGALAMSVPKLSPAEEAQAQKLYFDKCSHCHGVKGAGDGYAAKVLRPLPRDFTSCQWKFRSSRPTEDTQPTLKDLFRSITNGMPGTSMPAWGGDGVLIKEQMLAEADRWLLAKYIMRFCETMADPEEAEPKEHTWPTPGDPTPEQLKEGQKLFNQNCATCHGESGRGNGPQAPVQTFDISPAVQEAIGAPAPNVPIWPRDLRKPWTFRNGSNVEDIYRTITTGLLGSPMSSFAEQLTDEQRTAVAQFVKSRHYPDTIRDISGRKEAVVAELKTGKISLDLEHKMWKQAEEAAFPLIGQIIAPPRMFWPSNDLVWVKAVYTKDEVGVYVKWDDRTGPQADPKFPTLKENEKGKLVVVPASAAVAVGQKQVFKAYTYAGEGKFDEVKEVAWSVDNATGEVDAAGNLTVLSTGALTVKAKSRDGKEAAGAVLGLKEDVLHVQVPTQFYEGVEKPHFLNGDPRHTAHLWTFSSQNPGALKIIKSQNHFEKDQTEAPELAKFFRVKGQYLDGQWHVIIVRDRKTTGKEAQIPFEDGRFTPMAFNTTDGDNGEAGMMKAISSWFALLPKPPPDNSAKTAGLAGFGATFLLLLLIAFIVKRYEKPEAPAASSAQGEA